MIPEGRHTQRTKQTYREIWVSLVSPRIEASCDALSKSKDILEGLGQSLQSLGQRQV